LPASMCAMMPKLRTLLRSVSTSCATGFPICGVRWSSSGPAGRVPRPGGSRHAAARLLDQRGVDCLPAVVREGLVGLRHLVSVLATLDRGAEAVARVEDLVGEAVGHRLLTTGLGVAGEPAQRERVG